MSQVVQAKCPHCNNVLRIPAEWLSKLMRCKHCEKMIQAKDKSAATNSTNVAAGVPASIAKPNQSVPIAKPAPAVEAVPTFAVPPQTPSNAPFGFTGDEPVLAPKVAKPSKSKAGGLLLLVVMFFFLFMIGIAGAGFVVYKVAANWGEITPPKELAKNNDVKPVAVKDRDKPKPTDGAAKVNGKSKDGAVANKDARDKPPTTKDDSPKTDATKKNPPPFTDPNKDKTKKDGKKPPPPPFSNDPFPRRALLINVNNYLMFSTVHYGSGRDSVKGGYPGSSTGVLRDLLSRPPMNFPVTQVTELSDGVPPGGKVAQPHSTQKSVLEMTIRDFVETSRAQDRVIVFFAGHAASVDDKAYLVPIDGDLKIPEGAKVPEKLIPLKWVFDQLASCRAQQKILILDVFRYSPSRGHELPSPGEGAEGAMPEAFDKELLTPPPGVQVWCSCQKEQVALELDGGSAFMQALCHALQGGPEMVGIATASQPIPIEDLVVKVNLRLVDLANAEKKTQIARLTGKASDNVVAFNKDEPLAPTLTLKPPMAPGGEAAGTTQVNNILDEIRLLPAWRDTRAGDTNLLKAQNLPAFSAKKLDGYKADDYQNVTELFKRYQSNKEEFTKQFPLRGAYFESLEALEKSSKITMREVLRSPIDPKQKARFKDEQTPLGISMFELDRVLETVKKAGEQREMETSRRWQANFDYAQARLQSRLIYLFEYNYTLGQIRADNLPDLAPGQSGWRVGITGAKINVTEKKAKDLAKANKGLFEKIQEQYPGTPWALLAQRESVISLGLAWRPKSD